MNNLEEVRKLLIDVQSRVDAKAGLTAENRYWSILVASTITGLMLAKRIGLIDYDVKKVFAWAVEKLKENKRQVEDMSVSVEETLNDYIHEHWSNVLWIKSTDDLRLSRGTHMNLPPTWVIQVDCSIENENKTGNT